MTADPRPPLLAAVHRWTRLPHFPVVLRRTLERERHDLHALGELLAREKVQVALLRRTLAQESTARVDAERDAAAQKARGDRHFDRAERQVAEHNAALGLRDGAGSDELPPRPEPTVRMTANRRRLQDVSQPAAAFVHPARAGGASPAPAPAGGHPPRPA